MKSDDKSVFFVRIIVFLAKYDYTCSHIYHKIDRLMVLNDF